MKKYQKCFQRAVVDPTEELVAEKPVIDEPEPAEKPAMDETELSEKPITDEPNEFVEDKSVIEPADEPVVSASSTEADQLQADITTLFNKCLACKKFPILFSVEDEPYCTSFAKSSAHLPLALQSLFDPAHLENDYLQLVEEGENMPGLLDVTPLQQKNLEELTRGQANSRLWMRYHAGRITASRLYKAVHTDPHKPAVSLIYGICYPETTKFTTPATQYGCEIKH